MKIYAKIINALPENKYIAVDENAVSYTAICSGSIKKEKIYVGDFVNIEKSNDAYIIKKVCQRKNSFIRPRVANIDYMVLCISLSMPEPDFMLLDKQIIMCKKCSIEPIICLTKMDLLNRKNKYVFSAIKNVYEKIIDKVWYVSNKKIEYRILETNFEKGKTYAFSGNSGVGKTTMISNITNEKLDIGNIAHKTNRGKNTTKHVRIYNTKNLAYIVDTPGFSGYDVIDVEKDDLKNFYPEFFEASCKYLDCCHVNESDDECQVKQKLNNGEIDIGRYKRYVEIYNILKENENYKYKR